MKQFFFGFFLAFVVKSALAQNVGIGTTMPKARLHVTDSSVLFSATGNVSNGDYGNPPASGGGRRMMWYSDKAAFRAGYVSNGLTLWDKDSIGVYSVAFGSNTKAIGPGSVAMGVNNVAEDLGSTAMGFSTRAASGATAMGQFAVASGGGATAIGNFVNAPSYAETAIGSYNTFYTLQSTNSVNSLFGNDRIFSIGNGTGSVRSNAITVLKNANTGIGTDTPKQKLDIYKGRLRFTGDPATSVAQGIEFTNSAGGALNGFVGTFNDSMIGLYGYQGSGWSFLHNNKNGYIGLQGNSNPRAPLSFSNAGGNKIALYGNADAAHYGLGIQGYQMQLYTDANNSDITFGYGNSVAFTENMRIKGNGNVGIGGTAPYKLTVNITGDGIYQQDATGTAAVGFFVTPSIAYLQTKTNTPLAFATNDASAQMQLSTNGNLKIGIGTPATEKLEVAGSIKIIDGTQGANKVLTSDANGKASWKGSTANSAFRASFPTTIMANASATLLPYNTSGSSNFDDGGNWSNANNRYTAVETGVYHFDAIVSLGSFLATTSAGATISLEMHKNNSSSSESETRFSTNAGGTFNLTVNLSWTVKLNAGEFLNFQLYQISGSDRPVTGILSGYRLY